MGEPSNTLHAEENQSQPLNNNYLSQDNGTDHVS